MVVGSRWYVTLVAVALLFTTVRSDVVKTSVGSFLARNESEPIAEFGVVGTDLDADDEGLSIRFQEFKRDYGRQYDTAVEEAGRFVLFRRNLAKATSLNAINGLPVFGVSHVADLDEAELMAAMPAGLVLENVTELAGGLQVAPRRPVAKRTSAWSVFGSLWGSGRQESQEAIDWRRADVVSPVKTQGSCGACWAFSATQEIESMYALWIGALQTLSVQQITSCAERAHGCGGGNPIIAYKYVQHSGALVQDVFWPFAGGLFPSSVRTCGSKSCTQSCSARNLSIAVTRPGLIGPYATVTKAYFATVHCAEQTSCKNQDMDALAQALVDHGPISVIVNAKNWSSYTGGVLTAAACGNILQSDMNHAVQLVGYNDRAATPYWLVRNTWSTLWGEDGYIRLEKGPGKNPCGIANLATFPRVGGLVRPGTHALHRFKDLQRIAMDF